MYPNHIVLFLSNAETQKRREIILEEVKDTEILKFKLRLSTLLRTLLSFSKMILCVSAFYFNNYIRSWKLREITSN